jgi:peptidyl-prolyl cis-trans isomerase D
MLQKIRDKITGWFAIVFLGAIAIVFIFWGIQFESSVNVAAATVNGEKIPVETVRRAWQDRQSELQQLTRDELPPELVQQEQQRILEDYIRRELLAQRAAELGYRVSDRQLAAALAEIPALQVDGVFSRDRYAALLRAQGRSEAEFEAEFRRDLEIGRLRNAVAVSAFALPGELRRRIELEGEVRDLDMVVLPAAQFASSASVTPEEVADWYRQHEADYRTTESVALQYVQLSLADVEKGIEVTEEALRKYYDEVAADRFQSPERRRARHILIEAGTDDAAAKARAEALAERARAGEDFAALAAQNSDDPGSKGQGGDLGWATRESFVAPFADALFSMEKGEIRGPVQTQFGYHVIKLDDVEASHLRSFDEVRAELESDYRRDRAQAQFYERSQQLADEAFASLNELESVAARLGLETRTVEVFTRQGGGPFGADRKLIDAAFSDEVLLERQNSPAINFGDDSVVVLRVTDYRPPVQRPLEEVQDEVEQMLRAQRAREAAEAAAKAAAARLAAGEAWTDVAQSLGLQPMGARTVTRTEEALPPQLLNAVFTAVPPATGQLSSGVATLPDGDVALFVVTAVRPGSMASPEAAAEFAASARRAAEQMAIAEFSSYVAELERNAEIKRNPKLFE